MIVLPAAPAPAPSPGVLGSVCSHGVDLSDGGSRDGGGRRAATSTAGESRGRSVRGGGVPEAAKAVVDGAELVNLGSGAVRRCRVEDTGLDDLGDFPRGTAVAEEVVRAAAVAGQGKALAVVSAGGREADILLEIRDLAEVDG